MISDFQYGFRSYEISGQVFGFISSFLSKRQLRVVLNGSLKKNFQLMLEFQGLIPGPTLFLLYIKNLLDDVVCDIAIYVDDITLYSKCDQASVLWQQLKLA